MAKFIHLLAIALLVTLITVFNSQSVASSGSLFFHSLKGREHEVSFNAYFRTEQTRLQSIAEMSATQKKRFTDSYIVPVSDYLFGPLVHSWTASPQRATSIEVNWEGARLVNGKVEIPYTYKGIWIIHAPEAQTGSIDVPVPLSTELVLSPNWKKCTDSDPEHQTVSFYWYFWDPKRFGCDHKEGVNYQMVKAFVGKETPNIQVSYPEYQRILSDGALTITLAFGYVKDPASPRPDTNTDYGAGQYRSFLSQFRRQWVNSGNYEFTETPILLNEYPPFPISNQKIGSRFTGESGGIKITVNVLIAANIDQMQIFAKSFAHDHDDVFAWFGHSRVGSGFDAQQLEYMLKREPEYYRISTEYQMVYWAGCNSYSYYTLPFFKLKAQAANGADPAGTKNLDIIANGMPSYFSLNADNAMTTAYAFLNWQKRFSYQDIIKSIEDSAEGAGIHVLAAVLGDEDNPVD